MTTYTVNNTEQEKKIYCGREYEHDLTTNTQYNYIYVGNTPIALYVQGDTNAMYTLHTNYIGSIEKITNTAGEIVDSMSYTPFGQRRLYSDWSKTDTAKHLIDRGFTGQQHLDNFALINFNGRMYDPVLAHFLSPDPYIQSPENPLNYNRYAYCLFSPLQYVDPSGLLIDDPPYSGYGHNMRRLIANTFNVSQNINNVFEAGLNSILQSNNVNVTGQALAKIKEDPAIKDLEKKYLESVQSNPQFGEKEFKVEYSNLIQFGGKRAPESMSEQFKDPFNPKYKDTWEVATNELTWLVRSATIKTIIIVTKDGNVFMNHSFKDKLDLRPSEGRSVEYNRVTSILGFLYHDILGGNDEMTVSASWSKAFNKPQ